MSRSVELLFYSFGEKMPPPETDVLVHLATGGYMVLVYKPNINSWMEDCNDYDRWNVEGSEWAYLP
jgi:hypothetical protein